ncbi:ferrous iron transporter B [Ectopseudomonas mendocina]|uniref:Ferrous iron transporter B n=1 Tax=Ectopseudomonas mendocina TaxID=300 RepID=A0ABZ2RKQ8_ECTME
MASGATSLNLVRDELFATLEEAETCLEHFIVDRNNASLLQQAVANLQQVRGTFNLIELAGAELLAQEMLTQAGAIPVGADDACNTLLTALSKALHVLRRYLENLETHRQEFPELLLPAINDLRQAAGQPVLPESFFYTVRLDNDRPASVPKTLDESAKSHAVRRLRHGYQAGLLSYLRESNTLDGLKLMERALTRLDSLHSNTAQARLFWIAAAAAEAHADGQLIPRKERKALFARVERELKAILENGQYEPSKVVLKELLYLVALAGTQGPLASEVSQLYGLMPLPFTDHMLEEEYQRLEGPGKAVLQSLSSAIRDELNSLKDMLDLVERGTFEKDSLGTLHSLLAKLSKTLGMVGLNSASSALSGQLPVVAAWANDQQPQVHELHKMADSLLYVEGVVADFERGERREQRANAQQNEADSFAQHQLNEARIVVLDEAQGGLALAKRAITAYLESSGDRMHLANVPFSLHALRGGLWFLGQERAAALVGACADYIQTQMCDSPQMPSEQMLETLADALSSLEYYLEGGVDGADDKQSNVLELASESVRALGMALEV